MQLTYQQAAERLGITYSAVQSRCRVGALKAERTSNGPRIPLAEIERIEAAIHGTLTIAELAERWFMTRENVLYILTRRGHAFDSLAKVARKWRISEAEANHFIRWYNGDRLPREKYAGLNGEQS